MNHSNMYVVGLGLCTFANIASEEMSRDLADEIEKLLGSSNTYIRKKVRVLHISLVFKLKAEQTSGCLMCSPGHQESS
jgi:AP-1 complex subunit gamma-1